MKFSIYNELFYVNEKCYLYNILSTALIEIDSEIENSIKNENVLLIPQQYEAAMKKMHFIVDDECKENQEYMYFYNSVRFGKALNTLQVVLIPSYGCNLVCPYCMQGLNKNNKTITEQGINSVGKFIRDKVEKSHSDGMAIKTLNIQLFGGEPLISKKEIFKFAEITKQIADEFGCKTNYSMTSNFTLVDDDIIDFVMKYDITTQVSIDGTKYQHNQSRIRKDGSGTYDTILSNLKRFKELGLENKVVIRLNVHKMNIMDADAIMAAVAPYSTDVYFGFVENFKGSNDAFSDCIVHSDYADVLTNDLASIYKKYGFDIPRPFGKMAPCSLNAENRFIIDPELNVYKCEVLLQRNDTKIGSINDDGRLVLSSGFYRQMFHSPERQSKCMECKLLPICGGGCVAKSYLDEEKIDGNFDDVNCFIDEETLVKYLKAYVSQK